MAKKPSFQFYPGDWMKDPALRLCSLSARGAWMDMLCLLHECPQRGVFRSKIGKKKTAVSIKNISNSIAGCKQKTIQELINNGVVYVARKDGALYSKRLVRDELYRLHKAKNGKKGGQIRRQNPKQTLSKTQAKQGSSTSTSTSTSDISNIYTHEDEIEDFFGGGKFSLQDCKDAANVTGVSESDAEEAFHFYNSQGWKKSNRMPITDIRSALLSWRNNKHKFQTDKNSKQQPRKGNQDGIR